MGTNLIPTNVLNLQPPSRICQRQKWIKKIWPRCSLLVSRRNCCLWGKTKHQHCFRHYTTCRRSEPQTFWCLLSVSYLSLLLRLSEECLFMSLGLRGTVKYFQAYVKPGITKRLQNLMITFFMDIGESDSAADETFIKRFLQIWGSSILRQSWNGRSRLALLTFLRVLSLNRSHLTPPINFRGDEVAKKSRNSNISLIYISICLTFG